MYRFLGTIFGYQTGPKFILFLKFEMFLTESVATVYLLGRTLEVIVTETPGPSLLFPDTGIASPAIVLSMTIIKGSFLRLGLLRLLRLLRIDRLTELLDECFCLRVLQDVVRRNQDSVRYRIGDFIPLREELHEGEDGWSGTNRLNLLLCEIDGGHRGNMSVRV